MTEYLETLSNIAYNEWQNHDKWTYSDMLNWLENVHGTKARLLMQLMHYDSQVCNGGHFQYFENGYAEGNGGCFVNHSDQIPMHEWMMETFKELGFDKLPCGDKILAVMKSFRIILDMEKYVTEKFEDEETGELFEEDVANEDYMQAINIEELSDLDDVYYNLIDLNTWENVLEKQAEKVLKEV